MKKMVTPLVGIVMGSDSDWPVVKEAGQVLAAFGVPYEARVISAHRTPVTAADYAAGAARRGLQIIIAAAGGAAHLGGVLAAHTTLPVIGIPVNGMDALLSTLQMPAGIPVATVTLGSAGPVNAGLLAVQILALSRADLRKQLVRHKRELQKKVEKGDRHVQADLAK
jgi:phosphoribosylaminoimidazole carboxylase PurE protein